MSASPVTSVGPEEVSTIEGMEDDDCLEYEEEDEIIEVRGGWGLDEEDDEDETTEAPVHQDCLAGSVLRQQRRNPDFVFSRLSLQPPRRAPGHRRRESPRQSARRRAPGRTALP